MSAMEKKWMIYGANGYTGELIAREAVRRGDRPVLAGRNAEKVDALAQSLGLDAVTFSLDDVQEIANVLQDYAVVLHCAGPFSVTAEPIDRKSVV